MEEEGEFNVYTISIKENKIEIEGKDEAKNQIIREEYSASKKSLRERLEDILNNFEPLNSKKEKYVNLIYKGVGALGDDVFWLITRSLKNTK